MEPVDAVLRFLESVGRRSEAEFYLALFRSEQKEQFAALSVDANVARHATEAVVLDLKFLASLGLFPVVVLGLFEPTDAPEHAARIRRRLERAGVPAALLGTESGLADRAAEMSRGGVVPIVPFAAADGATSEDRFTLLGALLSALATRKLIFLHRRGGLRQQGALVPLVNLTTDYDALAASRELSRKERSLLRESRHLVFDLVPHKLVISIASPLDLLRELFTVKGAGTLLRRGAVILRRAGFEELDVARLKALITSSFGRAARDEFFTRPVSRIYLEESYRGAAILCDTPLGAYLTKFAVEREAQGEGMGRDLWELLASDYPTVFWRSRPENPIGAWYAKLCDGFARLADWHVFWRGLPPGKIPEAIAYAQAQPVDLVD